MMRHKIGVLSLFLLGSAPACDNKGDAGGPAQSPADPPASSNGQPEPATPQTVDGRALARKYVIVDGHIDVPYRLEGGKDKDGVITEDVTRRTEKGDFDHPRAVEGGLDAPFMSIYVPARYQKTGGAKKVADGLIDMVEAIARQAPDRFALATTPAQVRANFTANKISLPMGIENGAAIEDDLANVEHFYRRGVRYITLTHSEDNLICDSSYAETRTHNGLSAFGKKVVAEMNRLGIMVDISHVSDDTFYQVLELSKAPVIASHSSARHFTPGFERNMSDDMIKHLADHGGVIMINFGSGFINQKSRESSDARRKHLTAFSESKRLERSDPKMKKAAEDYDAEHENIFATVEHVADHIEHVVKLVGVEHVGLGSDFDGVGDTLPVGLKDVSDYPNLLETLVGRGWSEQDIARLCGENVLRVWQAVEDQGATSH